METIELFNDPPESDTLPAGSPAVITLEEAGELFETLSSEKRRTILNQLSEEPTNAADLAEQLETSVQNVLYHIRKLRTAGLIQVVGTHYSPKGREMDLYAPAQSGIVIDVLRSDSETQDGQPDAPRTNARPGENAWPEVHSDG
ncbi:ArsR/SmtB family transcription factor [Halalkaliarchaeum desulfuricum]|nr:winged helix-turn-helix domain-containing protein [Halalkaliarchaeum desulfuricum]